MREYSIAKLKVDAKKVKDGYRVPVNVGMFKTKINITVKKIDKPSAVMISDLANTNDMDLKAFKVVLLFHYTQMCGLCDWGGMRGRDNPFKIETPDDAYSKSVLRGIAVCDPEMYVGRWCIISVSTEWESEHGVYVALRNGIIQGLACDYNIPFPQDKIS